MRPSSPRCSISISWAALLPGAAQRSRTAMPGRTSRSRGGIMLTTSWRLMFPTVLSETRYFWKAAKGGYFRTTFLLVVIHQASESGYHGTGSGGVTGWPSMSVILTMSGMYRLCSSFLTASAWPLEPAEPEAIGELSAIRAPELVALGVVVEAEEAVVVPSRFAFSLTMSAYGWKRLVWPPPPPRPLCGASVSFRQKCRGWRGNRKEDTASFGQLHIL